MDVAAPWTVLVSPLQGRVLAVLAGTTAPLTGREVHRLCGSGSEQGVRDILDRLARHGLAHALRKGHATLYTLNRDHLAAPAAETLAHMRTALIDRLREAMASWSVPPAHASLFGSASRADGDTDSDIDILVVRPDDETADDIGWRAQLDDLARSAYGWTGNHLAFLEYSSGELRDLAGHDAPIVADLRRDGIWLAGAELRLVLRKGKR